LVFTFRTQNAKFLSKEANSATSESDHLAEKGIQRGQRKITNIDFCTLPHETKTVSHKVKKRRKTDRPELQHLWRYSNRMMKHVALVMQTSVPKLHRHR
jgi:hypothetical protein